MKQHYWPQNVICSMVIQNCHSLAKYQELSLHLYLLCSLIKWKQWLACLPVCLGDISKIGPKLTTAAVDSNDEIFGMDINAWLAIIPGIFVTLLGMIGTIWILICCRKRNNTRKRQGDRRDNYIMSHQSANEQRPIYYPRYKYGPPTAPPAFEFI